MSTRLNDISNQLRELAHEIGRNPYLAGIARDLHQAADTVSIIDFGDYGATDAAPFHGTGVHRVAFILKGNEDATRRVVRRMLDTAGLTEVAFTMTPTTEMPTEAG